MTASKINTSNFESTQEVVGFQPLPGQSEITLSTGEKIWSYDYNQAGSECSELEHHYGIDVLGPNWEKYNLHAERIVVDWDDSMKDTGKFWIKAHREVLQRFGFTEEETTDDAILAVFGNIDFADTFGIERFQEDGTQFSKEEIWDITNKRAAELLAENPMDPLLVEALVMAREMGVHLAVWSSSPRYLIEAAIQASGLEDVFDGIIAVDDIPNDEQRKPHPYGVFEAVKLMDIARGYLQPGEDYSDDKPLSMNGVWVIGDSPNDIRGGKEARDAKNVHASTVWLENPLHGHNAHEKREKTIRGLAKTALRMAVQDIVPTVTIRTFDPEEMGYSRTTALADMDKAEVRKLTTVNRGLAEFLIMRGKRSQLFRLEAVRNALQEQSSSLTAGSQKGLNDVMSQGSTGQARRINKQAVVSYQTRADARIALDRVLARQGMML